MSESGKDSIVAGFSKEELIEGFRKGDPKVIHVIYELHFVRLCDFCIYIVGNSHDAQDIVSNIFEKLLTVDRKNKAIGQSLTDMNDILNYLYVAARNRCFNHLEQNKRKQEINVEVTERKYSNEDELDLEYHRGLGDLKLLETLYNLNQRSIQVLRKIYFEDKSYQEIAKEMSISVGAIGGFRKRGIEILAKQLNKEDFNYGISIIAIIILSAF